MNPFLAQIVMFAGNFAPRGWALCEGQLLPINQNQALFSLLGTTYGGDGRTTFALPDLRGRSPIQQGRGPGLSDIKLGQRGGQETKTLTLMELPNHFHTVSFTGSSVNAAVSLPAFNDEGTTDEAEGNILASGIENLYAAPSSADASLAPSSSALSGSVNSLATGNGQSFSIRNPFLGINYIIALQGTFPSRS
ncbi:tail fiber protein [Kordia algicida OT-1]|uniref:Phage Tail Collar n=1 Tax=Kordia algicida OT-1 TaxID=391587 RepID=A9DXD1_9FLAO|nr:tail fiber protein [Kordia algicida]EDP95989.1 phage Tail Collar [Kordia algicida OT-1]